MLYVNDNGSIQLTRGDTARFTVSIENDLSGEPYEIAENDTLRMTIKKKVKDETPLIQKVITGSNLFYFEPSDTKGLSYGSYMYDVELTTEAGEVYTVIEPNTFQLLTEVTF